MTVKPTVSLTDQGYAYARSLVVQGRFASISAVLQHGLHLVEQEAEERALRLAAIGADLDRRAAGRSIGFEEMDRRLGAWRATGRGSDEGPAAPSGGPDDDAA